MLNDVTVFNIHEYLSASSDEDLGEDALQQLLGIQTFLGYLQTFLGAGIGGRLEYSKLFWGLELGSGTGVWNLRNAGKVNENC